MKKIFLQTYEFDSESVYTSTDAAKTYIFSGKEWANTIHGHTYEIIDSLD